MRQLPKCVISECDSYADQMAGQPTRCEYHQIDKYGVFEGECYCSWGWADNMDFDVCHYHTAAYRREQQRAWW